MITVPPGYTDAVARTHAPRWAVDLLDRDGTVIGRQLVRSGVIIKDASADPRTRIMVDVPTQLLPAPIDQAVLPTGQRIRAAWSVHPGAERVTIAECEIVNSTLPRPESLWAITAMDRSAAMAGDLVDPGNWSAPGTNKPLADVIRELVERTWPGTAFDITGPALTMQLTPGARADGDPWEICRGMAVAAGSEIWFDEQHRCIVRPVPEAGAPVDALRVGDAGTATGYKLSHERGYSAVYLAYFDTDGRTLLRTGRWFDTRPDSPTSTARIGRVAFREDRKAGKAPTQQEADAGALALAARAAGRGRLAQIRHVPHPWLEPGDSVEVTFAGGPTETHVVDAVEIPIGAPHIQTTTLRNADYTIGAA